MTSWDALEAYLLDLVRKVGGVVYVLRDSGGRHLAPRPPPPVDRRATVDPEDEALIKAIRERFLEGDKGDKGDKPDNADKPDMPDRITNELRRSLEAVEQRILSHLDGMLEASHRISRNEAPELVWMTIKDPAGAVARYNARIEQFEPHAAALDEAVGVDFVRKGPGKRYVHREAALPFIAERYLSSYLLIIAFRDVGAVDAQGVILALERARAVISDMLEDLPPDDGGDRAIAHSQRPA